MRTLRPGSALLCLLLLSGCGRQRTAEPPAPPDTLAAPADTTPPPPPPPPDTLVSQPRYRSRRIAATAAIPALARVLGRDRFLLTLKANRRDSLHVRVGDSLMVPDSAAKLLDLAPFPRVVLSARTLPQLLLVSRRIQAFAAYDSGRLVRWGPTSTGRESLQTPEGLYHVNWKDRERLSTFNDEWHLEWYINLENFLGISFHLFDLPGYPASHSCIRLLLDDAMWLYDWVRTWRIDRKDPRVILERGTPVVVFDRFRFGRKSPWRRLAVDSTATNVPHHEVERALDDYLRSGRPTPVDSVSAAWRQLLKEQAKARADSVAAARRDSVAAAGRDSLRTPGAR